MKEVTYNWTKCYFCGEAEECEEYEMPDGRIVDCCQNCWEEKWKRF